ESRAGLFLEGYPEKISVVDGEPLKLRTSTSAAEYSIEIARIGLAREVVFQKSGIPGGGVQRIPENASSHGCGWPVSFEMLVPQEWRSGYYSVVFRVADRGGVYVGRNRRTAESEAFFIVRPKEPGKESRILFQLATNTYNAYTNWGGTSLYAYHGRAGMQGYRVSFQRPLSSQFPSWELPLAAWAEENKIALDYCANLDLEEHPELLAHYSLVLSVGHDEYWSGRQRLNVEIARERGVSLGFLSGNEVFWKVRFEDSPNSVNETNRVMVCYK
ncbi:MAG: N,N-dimethylformamidase beta subunit family domain-containing protein, partial [Planctomyces sp.]